MQQTRGMFAKCLHLVLLIVVLELMADAEADDNYRRQFYKSAEKKTLPMWSAVASEEDEVIPGQFIVGLKKRNFSSDQITRLRARLSKEFAVLSKSMLHFGAFKALFAHAASPGVASRALSAPEVDFIEPNRVVRSVGGGANGCRAKGTGRLLWGLTRTGRREAIPDEWRSYRLTYSSSSHNDGSGVDAYVLDTGILTSHVEFSGRASWGMTASDIAEPDEDLNGHGTHVSGTIGGDTVGVAKNVNLIAVKVLDGQGAGTTASMLEGIQWVINDFQNKEKQQGKRPKAVCNLSLGFNGRSLVSDYAVAHAVEAGLNMVVAAGNSYQDACLSSPRADSAITVAASNLADDLAKFSNWGSCVDIVAPGVDILSSYSLSDISYAMASGTSMAAPHVTGAVARFLSTQPTTTSPADVKAWLLDADTKGALTFVDSVVNSTVITESATPNALLYMNCEEMVQAPRARDSLAQESAAAGSQYSTAIFMSLCCAIFVTS